MTQPGGLMAQYIWEKELWPNFTWSGEVLLIPLGSARKAQGRILGLIDFFDLEIQADVLTEEAVTTTAIEGEHLNRDKVRSSIARRLGLPTAGLPETERQIDGLVEMILDASRNYKIPLTAERLQAWQASLFPTGYSGMRKIETGKWRSSAIEVVSGPIGKEVVHYKAPPGESVDSMIGGFIDWFEGTSLKLDGLVRSAIAHFWFVSIHPFEDGNGRIARTITDMALAQDEETGCRTYSMSAQIGAERDDYYNILEKTQKGSGDITGWMIWFLQCLERAIGRSETEVRKGMEKAQMWQEIAVHSLNDRQRKVINKLFEAGSDFKGGLTTRKYVGMTHVSRETAKRDIADLVSKSVLIRNPGGGRSTNYSLSWHQDNN